MLEPSEAGGWEGRRPIGAEGGKTSSKEAETRRTPKGAGQCLASSTWSMDACSGKIEAEETEGRNTRRRQSRTKKGSETETQKEERDRGWWGWWWLWSHREAIEKSRANELCVLEPGAEFGTSIGRGGDVSERKTEGHRGTEKKGQACKVKSVESRFPRPLGPARAGSRG